MPRKTSRGWVLIDSTTIDAVRYVGSKGELHVKFQKGSVYTHINVPSHIYAAFMRSNSKGAAYNRLIRNEYPVKIERKSK